MSKLHIFWKTIILAFALNSCATFHAVVAKRTQQKPADLTPATLSECSYFGADWTIFSLNNFPACENADHNSFGLWTLLPSDSNFQTASIHERETALQDWVEDYFFAKSGFQASTNANPCTTDPQTVCTEMLVRNKQGTDFQLLASMSGNRITFRWNVDHH